MKYLIIGYLITGVFASLTYPITNKFLLLFTWPVAIFNDVRLTPPITKFSKLTGITTVLSIWGVITALLVLSKYFAGFVENGLVSFIIGGATLFGGVLLIGLLFNKLFDKSKLSNLYGDIDEEFSWLTPETIQDELQNNTVTSKRTAHSLIQMAILGGITYKSLLLSKNELQKVILSSNSNLLKTNPDRITVEAIAFVWSAINRMAIRNDYFYDDDDLAMTITSAGQGIALALENIVDFDVHQAFSSKYNVAKSSEILSGEIQKIAEIGMLDMDSLYITNSTQAFTLAYLDTIILDAENILNNHFENIE